MTDHVIARDQLRAFIDRVLRLKEEQDAIGEDIREVYSEAKSMGFDKTVMGQLVGHLRKVEKKGANAVSEQSAIFDLYLDAYAGNERPSHAHTREGFDHDAETGEITHSRPSPKDEIATASDAPPAEEAVANNQPEKDLGNFEGHSATEFRPPVTTREGHKGDPSPTLGERDLVEAGTGQNSAVLPQEPCKADTPAQDAKLMKGEAVATVQPEVEQGAQISRPGPVSTDGETGMVLGTGRERPLSIGLHTDGDPEARFESASLHQPHSEPHLSAGVQSLPDNVPVASPSTGQGSDASPVNISGSSSGRTADFDSANDGSIPSPEANAPPVNQRCLKHQRGEECKFSHKRYSCAGCNQAAELQRAGAA